MLVLSRKPGERIRIGEGIVLTVVKINRNTVRVGIQAPSEVLIIREELAPSDDPRRKPKKATDG